MVTAEKMEEKNIETLERITEKAKELDEADKLIVEAFSTGYKAGLLKGYLEEQQKEAG